MFMSRTAAKDFISSTRCEDDKRGKILVADWLASLLEGSVGMVAKTIWVGNLEPQSIKAFPLAMYRRRCDHPFHLSSATLYYSGTQNHSNY